jgi:lysophospholipid acyltransferase (LPLAT)-like uncharacterized protein
MSRRRTLRRAAIVGWMCAWALRVLGATWRIRVVGQRSISDLPQRTRLGAIWHRDSLISAYLFRDSGWSTIVSRSRDGELIAAALGRLGYVTPPRGSSSRGGAAALRGLVRQVESGITVAIPTDGPRGPARQSKPGIVTLARRTGLPITPVVVSAKPCLHFGSWDAMRLPLPFARVVVRLGDELPAPVEIDLEAEQAWLRLLDRILGGEAEKPEARAGPRRGPGSEGSAASSRS